MVEKLGMEPNVAIAAFDLARGHRQERSNYLQHLRSRAWTRAPEPRAESRALDPRAKPFTPGLKR